MRILVLIVAVLCGLVAAFATMRLLDRRVARVPDQWTVVSMEPAEGGFRLLLDDGQRLRIDTAASRANARNVVLLYPGKTVAVTPADGCTLLVPLLQPDRPALTSERYARLREAGFSDLDLAVSYELPEAASSAPDIGGRGQIGVCVARS